MTKRTQGGEPLHGTRGWRIGCDRPRRQMRQRVKGRPADPGPPKGACRSVVLPDMARLVAGMGNIHISTLRPKRAKCAYGLSAEQETETV